MEIKELQSKIKRWTDDVGFKWSSYAQYCHLVEEVGELGEAITVKEGERKAGNGKKGLADHSDLKEELGDVLFSVTVIANRFNIDLEQAYVETVLRYNKKMKKNNLKNKTKK